MNLPSGTCAMLASPSGIPWLCYGGSWHQNVHCYDIARDYPTDQLAMRVSFCPIDLSD